ncbi:hypothetical protein HY643_00900 [Candidatus Woesearchaeota archaeon]|nr:hypothetical protein [Candidatus Woesearchaeota archaeon]
MNWHSQHKLTILIGICLALTVSLAFAYQLQHYYDLSLHYKAGEVSLVSIEVKPLLEDLETLPQGDYKLVVEDFNGKELYAKTFVVPNTVIIDSFNEEGESVGGGLQELQELDFPLQIPYFENAKEIKIISPKNKQLKISAEEFAQNTCGDDVCQKFENVESCSKDCKKEAPSEELAKKATEKEAAEKKAETTYTTLVIFLIIIILVGGYYLFVKPRKK